jgi:hypothetical protein
MGIKGSKDNEGEFVGLYIISQSQVSLAILMSLSSLQEKKHIKKIVIY